MGEPRRRRPHDYEGVYDGRPRWDIGRPQPALLEVARAGGLQGAVLDAGCGTGEHALMAAEMGFPTTGVDTAARAIALARAKASDRGLEARFEVCDATALTSLGERFGTALDSGLFHVLTDEDRVRYAAELAAVVEPGGRFHLLCFSDREPGDDGPRRITRDEIVSTFSGAWTVDAVEAARIDTTAGTAVVAAWIASFTRRE